MYWGMLAIFKRILIILVDIVFVFGGQGRVYKPGADDDKKQEHNSVAAGFSEVRSSLSHNLRDINYAARLWQVFKAIISGALNELRTFIS
jgi:hypothetical protein